MADKNSIPNGAAAQEERPSSGAIVPFNHSLLILEEATRHIAEMTDIADVLRFRDQAETLRAYLQLQGGHTAAYKAAAKGKLVAERKAGELLAEMPGKGSQGGDRKSSSIVRLDDLGLTKSDSSRWQKIATIPDPEWDTFLDANLQNPKSELTTAAALRLATELARQNKRKANVALVQQSLIEEEEKPTPWLDQQFPVIVIDPPWDWGDEGDVSQFGRGDPTYATVSADELATEKFWRESSFRRTIPEAAQPNAHIYLWITNRSLPKGFRLLEAWGFRYVTCLTWCKPSIGMGNYFRGSTEQVLFGVRGSLGLLRSDVGTWFSAPRGKRHSDKPGDFYTLVESCSPGPWLEMFARNTRPGWCCWGAEA